jgi:hypothetical protein
MGGLTDDARIYRQWRNRALLSTAVLVVLAALVLRCQPLYLHYLRRYNETLIQGRNNKTTGLELFDAYCRGKPHGYKTDVIDCGLAAQWSSMDPETVAQEEALQHLWYDDLSLVNWLLGCHDGRCDSWLWKLSDKVLMHYHTTVFLVALAFFVVLWFCTVFFCKCHNARKVMAQTDRVLQQEPRVKAQQQLVSDINDFTRVMAALDSPHSYDILAQPRQRLVNALDRFQAVTDKTRGQTLTVDMMPLLPPPQPRAVQRPCAELVYKQSC